MFVSIFYLTSCRKTFKFDLVIWNFNEYKKVKTT